MNCPPLYIYPSFLFRHCWQSFTPLLCPLILLNNFWSCTSALNAMDLPIRSRIFIIYAVGSPHLSLIFLLPFNICNLVALIHTIHLFFLFNLNEWKGKRETKQYSSFPLRLLFLHHTSILPLTIMTRAFNDWLYVNYLYKEK